MKFFLVIQSTFRQIGFSLVMHWGFRQNGFSLVIQFGFQTKWILPQDAVGF